MQCVSIRKDFPCNLLLQRLSRASTETMKLENKTAKSIMMRVIFDASVAMSLRFSFSIIHFPENKQKVGLYYDQFIIKCLPIDFKMKSYPAERRFLSFPQLTLLQKENLLSTEMLTSSCYISKQRGKIQSLVFSLNSIASLSVPDPKGGVRGVRPLF